MRRLFVVAAAAASLLGGLSNAYAASVIVGSDQVLVPPSPTWFGANVSGGPTSFDHVFTFIVSGSSGFANSQITTLLLNGSQNIDFTSIILDSNYAFKKTSADPGPETWAILDPVFLDVGSHTISVAGNLIGPNGSYAGTINVAAVPEPASWGMMLVGFGAIGFAMRRRKRRTGELRGESTPWSEYAQLA